MARYTDDLRAARAIREAQARHDAAGPADCDGFTVAEHFAELQLSAANLNRAICAGEAGAIVFESEQVAARARAITGLARVQELLA